MKTKTGTAAALAAAALLLAWAASASAGTFAALTPRIAFDNPYILAGRGGSRYLEIEVGGPEGSPEWAGPRPPLNLVMVIDRSGSMAAAGKMDFVHRAALDIASRLGEGDTFALVAFSDWAEVVVPSTDAGWEGRFDGAIRSLRPGGSTNLGEGLEYGYREARRNYRPGAVNRLILLTDGLANRGVTDPWSLQKVAAAEAEEGVALSAFGVGVEYNEDLLTGLADAGRGSYYYIASPWQIPEMIAGEFGTVAAAAYLDVTIFIELREGCRLEHVLGYPYRMEGRRAYIHLGDIPRGSHRRIMARISHGGSRHGELEVGKLGFSYKEPGKGESRRQESRLALQVTADEKRLKSGRNAQVEKKAALAEADEKMSQATRMVDKGDFRGAEKALKEADKVLETSPVQDEEVKGRKSRLREYGEAAAAAPSMSAEQKSVMQKKTKYEIYRTQRQ